MVFRAFFNVTLSQEPKLVIDYSDLIYCLKNRYVLVLPNIGSIYLSIISSEIADNGSVITSPKYTLEFRENDYEFLEFQRELLAWKWKLQAIQVDEIVEKYTQKIREYVKSGKTHYIPSLGSFSSLGNQVIFKSSGEFEIGFNYFNQDFPLYKKFIVSEKLSINHNLKEDEWMELKPKYWRIAAAFLLFLIGGMMTIGLVPSHNARFVPASYSLDKTGYKVEEFNRAPETDGSEKNQDIFLKEEPTTEIENPSVQEHSERLTESCIFITGSFSKSTNVKSMMSKLNTQGYQTYQEEYNGLTRVGVVLSCDSQNEINKLDQIEKNYWQLEK